MIDRKYHRIVFSFFMSLLMSGIMSLVVHKLVSLVLKEEA